ncbi:protein YgfX [Rickettsiella endosymbiont of Litargus connexus]|uniref:protein YgfX n=1 Tax=Rickettsiella endosymbiont of Litargus connexus TaxID=3066237 RepID=UPI00376EA9D8
MAANFYRLKSSYYLAILLLVVHGGAIACLCFLPWPWWTKLLLSLACLMSFVTLFCQYVLLNNPYSIIEFWQQQSIGCWQLRNNLGEVSMQHLADDSICTRYFVLLNFVALNKKKTKISLVLLPDSLNFKDFKQLRRQLQSVN